MLLVDFVLVLGLIYPLILYFLCNDQHPYHAIYACITPIITAFFSGDSNLSLQVNLRHARESLGVHQPSSGLSNNNLFCYDLAFLFKLGIRFF